MLILSHVTDKKHKHILYTDENGIPKFKSDEAGLLIESYNLYDYDGQKVVRIIKYAQSGIKAGFKIFDYNNNLLIRGVEALFDGYKIKKGGYFFKYADDSVYIQEIWKNEELIAKFPAYDFGNDPICEIEISEEKYMADILSISIGVLICQRMN